MVYHICVPEMEWFADDVFARISLMRIRVKPLKRNSAVLMAHMLERLYGTTMQV